MKLKRWLRRLKWIAIGLVLVLVIVALVLPTVVSGEWGRTRLAAYLSDRLGTPVRLEALDFGWTTGLVVDRIEVGRDGDAALSVRRITAKPELLSLLGDELRLRRVEIEGVDVSVVRSADGRVTLEGWPRPDETGREPTEDREASAGPRLSGVIALREANVRFRDEGTGAHARVDDVSLDLTLGTDALRVTLALAGFRFEGEIDAFADGRLRDEPGVRGTAKFDDVFLDAYTGLAPLVDGIDDLAGRLSGTVTVGVSSASRFKISATNLIARHEGAGVSIVTGSYRDDGEIKGAIGAFASADALHRLLGDRLPAEARGDATIDLLLDGTLRALTASGEVRVGASRLVIDRVAFADVLSSARTGVVKATWTSSLRLSRPDFAPEIDLDGSGEGTVFVRVVAGDVEILTTSTVRDLAVVTARGLELREPTATLGTRAVIRSGGAVDVFGVTVETPRLEASFEGPIADVFRAPSGSGKIEANGRIESLHPFLTALGANAPNGVFDAKLEGKITRDALAVGGRVATRTLTIGPDFSAETAVVDAALAADGTWKANVSADGLHLARPAPAVSIVEPTLKLDARGVWPRGRELPVVESARLDGRWGTLDFAGGIPLGEPAERGRGTVDIDVDLPKLVAAYPAYFPARIRTRGRATGLVSLAGRVDAPRSGTASGTLAVERVGVPGYDVTEGRIDLRYADGVVTVDEATGRVNDGATRVTGTVDLTGTQPTFEGNFDTKNMRLAPAMEPLAAYATPIFALASDLSGEVSLKGTFESRGLDAKTLLDGLAGDLTLRVDRGQVAGSPLLRSLLTFLKRDGGGAALRFDGLNADLRVRDGKMVTEDLRILARDLDIRFRGMTGLSDRSIAYGVRVKLPGKASDLPPLLRAIDAEGYIPFRLGGTLTAPSLLPPDPKDIGKSLLEDALKDLLGGKLKPPKKR